MAIYTDEGNEQTDGNHICCECRHLMQRHQLVTSGDNVKLLDSDEMSPFESLIIDNGNEMK